MKARPSSAQGSGICIIMTIFETSRGPRDKRDSKAEVRRLKSGSKFRTLQPSDFSLLHPSCYSCQSRQARFVICPQCPISIELLSRKVDSATDCVYSYRFERAPSRSNSVEERARISTAHIILSRGLTSVPVDEMSEEERRVQPRHGCCCGIPLLVEVWRPRRRKPSVATAGWTAPR